MFPILLVCPVCNFTTWSFVHFAASFASFYDIQVWIQAVKIEQIWRFHDESLVSGVFPISMSNNPEETHLRARSKENFRSGVAFTYVCKYYGENNVYLKTTDKHAQDENKIIPQ